jgi:hypothetical protein
VADRPARYARLHALVAAARSLSDAERERLLDAACGDDESLRAEVLTLLAAGAQPSADVFSDASVRQLRMALDGLLEDREGDRGASTGR